MKKLLIISGKGGTGKTTVAASLIRLFEARAFADCDVDAPNLHLVHSFPDTPETRPFIGAEKARIRQESCVGCGTCADHCRFHALERTPDHRFRVNEIACEGCGVCVYVCPHGAVELSEDTAGTLSLFRDDTRVFSTAELKMGRGNSGKLVSEVKDALFSAVTDEPIAVLDGSPGIGCPVIASLNGVDMALIVTEPTLSGRHDMERIVKTVSRCCVKAAVCINRYDVNPEISGTIETFCRENAVPFVGKIPYDRRAADAANEGKTLIEYDGKAADALRLIGLHTVALMAGMEL